MAIYGNLREIYRYGNSTHVSFHGVTLDDKGEFPFCADSFLESYLADLLVGNADKNTQEYIFGEFHKICEACLVYPYAATINAQFQQNRLIYCLLIKGGKIITPNQVRLISNYDKDTIHEPPDDFPGCAVVQALLGIYGGETIPPPQSFKIRH